MLIDTVDKILKKSIMPLTFAGVIIILFSLWKACKRVDAFYLSKCRKEKNIAFQGVVTNYTTNVFAEISTFILDGSNNIIKIPRSIKEVYLANGDTVVKTKGSNVYIVKRTPGSTRPKNYNAVDTISFECTEQ